MKKILSAVIATLVAISFSAVVFAADAAKPVVPADPAPVSVQKDVKTEKADAKAAKSKIEAEAKEAKAKAKAEAKLAKAKAKAEAKLAKAKVKADAQKAKDAKDAKEDATPAAK